MDEYKSVVDNGVIREFDRAYDFEDLFSFATRACCIDGIIAAANFLCPDMICVRGYVFIKAFFSNVTDPEDAVKKLEESCNYDKKAVEMSVNTWSIGDFFIGNSDPIMDNEKVLQAFGETVAYFWQRRAKELFPEKNIIAELGNNLMGEYGPCITMYEA